MTSRRHLKTAFITTIAAGTAMLSLASGCGGEVFSSGAGGSGSSASGTGANPPQPECPEALPEAGASCENEGLSCLYDNLTCNPTATCNGGAWDIQTEPACNPPPCPDVRPADGSSCANYVGYQCEYPSELCAPATALLLCDETAQTWSSQEPLCNPPPPENCYSLTSPDSCKSEIGCDWQEPGCEQGNALPFPGCHPTTVSCENAEWLCDETSSCQQVSVDPCWDAACNACSEQLWLCVPETFPGG